MSISKASSKASTSSTRPSESAPRSSMKLDSGLMSFSSTSSCSLMMRLTSVGMSVAICSLASYRKNRRESSASGAKDPARATVTSHVHAAVHAEHLAGNVPRLFAREVNARRDDVPGGARPPEGNDFDEFLFLFGAHRRRHVRVDVAGGDDVG